MTTCIEKTTKSFDELLEIAREEGVVDIHFFDLDRDFGEEGHELGWHFDIYDDDPHTWHSIKFPWFSWKYKNFFIRTIRWSTYGTKKNLTQG